MAREMYLAGVKPEELEPTPPAPPPTTPGEKWENFWYHHKWKVIIIGFLAIALGVILWQTLTVDRADYTVLMTTKYAYSTQQLDALEKELARYGDDLDGDGKVEVEVLNCYLGAADATTYYANHQALEAHLVAGDVMLFLWEPEYYSSFVATAGEATGDGYCFLAPLPFTAPGVSEDTLTWNWAQDGRLSTLPDMPDDLYFGVRVLGGTATDEKLQKQAFGLLERFAKNTPSIPE